MLRSVQLVIIAGIVVAGGSSGTKAGERAAEASVGGGTVKVYMPPGRYTPWASKVPYGGRAPYWWNKSPNGWYGWYPPSELGRQPQTPGYMWRAPYAAPPMARGAEAFRWRTPKRPPAAPARPRIWLAAADV